MDRITSYIPACVLRKAQQLSDAYNPLSAARAPSPSHAKLLCALGALYQSYGEAAQSREWAVAGAALKARGLRELRAVAAADGAGLLATLAHALGSALGWAVGALGGAALLPAPAVDAGAVDTDVAEAAAAAATTAHAAGEGVRVRGVGKRVHAAGTGEGLGKRVRGVRKTAEGVGETVQAVGEGVGKTVLDASEAVGKGVETTVQGVLGGLGSLGRR